MGVRARGKTVDEPVFLMKRAAAAAGGAHQKGERREEEKQQLGYVAMLLLPRKN